MQPSNVQTPCRDDRKHNNDATKQHDVNKYNMVPQRRVRWQQHASSAGMAPQHSYSKHNPGHNQEADGEMEEWMNEWVKYLLPGELMT